MAIYHCSVKIISRSSGRSSVGAAAYRAGEKIKNERDGITHDYTQKAGVVYSAILLPENTPTAFHNRAELWNAVERSEKRKDSQTAREIEVALPVEFTHEEQKKLLCDFANENFVQRGMIADLCIHDKKDGNPHAHIMLTTRTITPEGFKGKDRTWNDKKLLESWREQWSITVNQAYEKKNLPLRIDHRTLQAQGIEREATIHKGSAAHQMEQRGIQSDRGNINREVQERNRKYAEAQRKRQRMKEEGRSEQRTPATGQQKRDRSAEEMVERLCLYKRQYILKKQELQKISVEVSARKRQQEKLESQARDMSERLVLMQETEKQIRELERERKKMGIWKGREKKYLTSQIDQLTQSNQQVRQVFEAKFKVHPDQGLEAIEKLREQIRGLETEDPMQAMKDVRESVEELELQYKVEKALADIHPESRQIEERVLQREERFTAREESVENPLVTAEAKVRLKNVTVGDYAKILKRVKQEDAQKIADLVKQSRSERRKQKTKELEI